MIDCSSCTHIYIHKSAWGEFWCKKLGKYIYDLHNLKRRFKVACTHYENKVGYVLCEDKKLFNLRIN